MTPTGLEIVLRIPLAGGRFGTLILDLGQTYDFCDVRNWECRTNVAGECVVIPKSLKANDASASLRHSAPRVSQERRKSSPFSDFSRPKTTLTKSLATELAEAREILAEKSADLADLDAVLAPVWREEGEIKDAILATHGRAGNVVVLNLSRRGERVPLFARRDAIAREWGKTKGERRYLQSEIKELENRIDRFRRLIEAEGRKRAGGKNG